MTLDAAARIVWLQDDLDTARARIAELEAQQPDDADTAETDGHPVTRALERPAPTGT